MASITELWRDDFSDASVGLDLDLGNGTVTEPAGEHLLVGCTAGSDCRSVGATELFSPYATEDLEPLGADFAAGLVIIEARITGFTYSTSECIEYLILDIDRLHGFWFGWYPNNSNMYVQGRTGAAATTFWNGGTYTGPSAAPHVRRIVINRTHRAIRIPGVASQYPLNPGEVAFVNSINDGATWSWLHTQDLSTISPPGSPTVDYRLGFMARNWGSYPSMEMENDYLRVLQTTSDLARVIPKNYGEPKDEAAFTDGILPDVPTKPGPRRAGAYTEGAGGPDDHILTAITPDHQGGGAFVPQVARQPRTAIPSSSRRLDEIAFRDADNASSSEDEGHKALSVGLGISGPPRYTYPHTVPTSDERYGGPGPGAPEKKGNFPYPTDGRIIGSDISINSRWYGVNYGYNYPENKSKPHFSEAEAQDSEQRWLSAQTDFTTLSIDQYGRPHFGFADARPVAYHIYDTAGELWTTPTDPSFTGYARDGKYYVNGIDQGSQAPWALEAASSIRGGRSDFPNRALIVAARNEVVIYDLVNYPTTLNLWMRFSLNDTYWMMGRGASTPRDVAMKDGILVVSTQQTPWESGRIHIVNFKATDNHCAHLIGPGNHWYWQTGYDITHRNESGHWQDSGPSPELRIFSEYNRNVSMYLDNNPQPALPSPSLFIAAAGEDAEDPVMIHMNPMTGIPLSVTQTYGEEQGISNEATKCCLFDSQGHLWHSVNDLLFHNGRDYQHGVIYASIRSGSQRYARLPSTITHIEDDGNLLWLGTADGVYRLDKGTLSHYLAYSIVGGGGRGRLGIVGTGELIPGVVAAVSGMSVVRLSESSFLAVSTGPQADGGAAVIRLYDDAVLDSKVFPALDENGAYSHGTIFG